MATKTNLPTPEVVHLAPGVSMILPLSRRGVGPGIILLVPATFTSEVQIEDGVPSPFIKWAEESYTVLQIQESVLGEDTLRQAVDALSQCEECYPVDTIGLVAYAGNLWNRIADYVDERFKATVVYADICEASTLAPTPVPILHHFSGKVSGQVRRTGMATEYDYPNVHSSFALPFQPEFNYRVEAISHTRNLTHLKKLMDGPHFDLEAIWEKHTYHEFGDRSVDATMATMVEEPYMTGGIGRAKLTDFYRDCFIPQNPADTELELISRMIGIDRVVDEFIFKMTHDRQVDALIPGIPPTGRKLEIPMTAIVNIRGDRLYHEHISWDQATVLVQLDIMPQYLPFPYTVSDQTLEAGKRFEVRAPVAGVETARKLVDRNSVPSNEMFRFQVRQVSDE